MQMCLATMINQPIRARVRFNQTLAGKTINVCLAFVLSQPIMQQRDRSAVCKLSLVSAGRGRFLGKRESFRLAR